MKRRLTQIEFDNLVSPKLKLFLSVDIVGSTAYKQRLLNNKKEWLIVFLGFFESFPTTLNTEISENRNREPKSQLESVKLWKTLGDELIFTVDIKNKNQPLLYLQAFAKAVKMESDAWRTDNAQPSRNGLNLKGTCWLAGFPVGNTQIPMDNPDSELIDANDYIGPLIDIGFRIKEYAKPKQPVISAELAFFLVCNNTSDIHLYYEGDHVLKGVLGGMPYPIVRYALVEDDENSSATHKEKLQSKLCRHIEVSDLKKYLKLWFKETSNPMPFINGDEFGEFKRSATYNADLSQMREDLGSILLTNIEETKGAPQRGNKHELKTILERLDEALAGLPKLED